MTHLHHRLHLWYKANILLALRHWFSLLQYPRAKSLAKVLHAPVNKQRRAQNVPFVTKIKRKYLSKDYLYNFISLFILFWSALLTDIIVFMGILWSAKSKSSATAGLEFSSQYRVSEPCGTAQGDEFICRTTGLWGALHLMSAVLNFIRGWKSWRQDHVHRGEDMLKCPSSSKQAIWDCKSPGGTHLDPNSLN